MLQKMYASASACDPGTQGQEDGVLQANLYYHPT